MNSFKGDTGTYLPGSATNVKMTAAQRESRIRRSKKAEAAAMLVAEEIRKSGIACLPIRMATFFGGTWFIVTCNCFMKFLVK